MLAIKSKIYIIQLISNDLYHYYFLLNRKTHQEPKIKSSPSSGEKLLRLLSNQPGSKGEDFLKIKMVL